MSQIKLIIKIVTIIILINYANGYAQNSQVNYYKDFDIFKMQGLQPISKSPHTPYIKVEYVADTLVNITVTVANLFNSQKKLNGEVKFIKRDSCYYMLDTSKTEDPNLNSITSIVITPTRIIVAKQGFNIRAKIIDSENLQEFYPSLKSVSSTPCGKDIDNTIITPKTNIIDSARYGRFCDIQYITYVPMKNYLITKETIYFMSFKKEKIDGKVIYSNYTTKEVGQEKLYYKDTYHGAINNFSFFWHIFFNEMPWKD